MKSLINLAFQKSKKENRPALLTYTVAGDNTKKKSLEILRSISDNADILEIGFPHNAPTADGGQIQNSSYRALKNELKLNDVFKLVKEYKKYKNTKTLYPYGLLSNGLDTEKKNLLRNVNR